MKVSIIIPCYNDGKYLPEAISSAKAQTYRNIEIIIVDDHSTDPLTYEVLAACRDKGVTVIQTPEGKKGLPAARNAGIEAASGAYIFPLDADDTISPRYLEKAAAVLEAHPEVAVCGSWFRFFGLRRSLCVPPPYKYENILLEKQWLVAAALFRRKDWVRVGGYDERLILGKEDMAFWLDVLRDGGKVHFIEEPLFFYRIKPYSMTAAVAGSPTELDKTAALYAIRADIYREYAFAFVAAYIAQKSAASQRECLFSWKVLRHVMRLEWFLRQKIKRLFGRA